MQTTDEQLQFKQVIVILLYNMTRRFDLHSTNLRKVGGSIMLAIPPALLKVLHLREGEKVDVEVNNGCLVIEPAKRPHYTLDKLLAQCNASAKMSKDDQAWLNDKPVGKESL